METEQVLYETSKSIRFCKVAYKHKTKIKTYGRQVL